MVLYTVECSFVDPKFESEWNDFYTLDKLPKLISVPGFFTSQRFRTNEPTQPTYLAIHTVANAAVLESAVYREKGGGNFARWQTMITDWYRNIYSGIDVAPSIGMTERLLVSNTGPDGIESLGAKPAEIVAVGMQQTPARRWMATSGVSTAAIAGRVPADVIIYEPMGLQLQSVDLHL